jgi:hypothetical protein
MSDPLSSSKVFPFIAHQDIDLQAELLRPFSKVSILIDTLRQPMEVVLWREDGSGLRVSSEMFGVAFRMEIGILNFEVVSEYKTEDVEGYWKTEDYSLAAFRGTNRVEKFVIEESGCVGESGIAITSEDGATLILLAHAFPCHIAIKGVSDLVAPFEPEYELSDYSRVSLKTILQAHSQRRE